MRVAQRLWQVGTRVIPREIERAARRLVATPDRRLAQRESLDGVSELVCATSGRKSRVLTIDFAEGGISVMCKVAPELGELVRLDVGGLVVEGRVRHIAADGEHFRIGIEST